VATLVTKKLLNFIVVRILVAHNVGKLLHDVFPQHLCDQRLSNLRNY
jgi:hypothetical protein